MSASSSKVHQFLRVANICTRVVKNEQILGTVVFQKVDKVKVNTLKKLKIINFFLQDIIEWLRVLIEKIKILSNLGWIIPTFYHSCLEYVLPESLRRTRDIKMRFFVEINLFRNLVKIKCILLHCTRFLRKLQIRQKSWRNVYAKSNRNQSRVLQKIGTKTQLKI